MKLFVVIGLGQFGRSTARVLYKGGGDVLAIDKREERVEEIKEEVGQAICANASDIEVLRAIGVEKADTAVLALGENDLEAGILATTALADLGVGRIIVRAGGILHGRILTRVGATKVIYPERQMGEQLAKSILAPSVLEQVILPTGQTVAHLYPKRKFVGKSIREAGFYGRLRLAVIGIQKPNRSVDDKGELHEELILHSVPSEDTLIGEDDILIVVGSESEIKSVARKEL